MAIDKVKYSTVVPTTLDRERRFVGVAIESVVVIPGRYTFSLFPIVPKEDASCE
jgi:hypothetical protein